MASGAQSEPFAMTLPSPSVLIASFYRFTPLPEFRSLREGLLQVCSRTQVRGTILLAHEGINGTLAGDDHAVREVLQHLERIPGCEKLEPRVSRSLKSPFHRMKVRLKSEIVTLGAPGVSPLAGTGRYVEPEDWNALIEDDDVILIDTRNDYETSVGTFPGAVLPGIRSFREFPAWFQAFRETLGEAASPPRIAMFCTGGIRCEKSTALLKSQGFEEIYHLKGGILNYLERIPTETSLWSGECFVFDERVTVADDLQEGAFALCRGCRRPLSAEDRASPDYEEGVSCPACLGDTTPAQRERFRERARQTRIAEARGEGHVGALPSSPRRSMSTDVQRSRPKAADADDSGRAPQARSKKISEL